MAGWGGLEAVLVTNTPKSVGGWDSAAVITPVLLLSPLTFLSSSPDSSQTLFSVLGVYLPLPLSVNLRELVSGQLHHDADIIPFVYYQEGEGETDCLP